MVNPKNPEGGREFVQIVNISGQTASLSGWQVVAPNGTTFEL
ncbi:MAG: lamin tail domain-containing protein [Symploca sp. SIO3C6]|nr:lamin tail domain-containing protein [Symploca sp. SIO3C6]